VSRFAGKLGRFGTMGELSAVRGHAPDQHHGSPRVPPITGHGLHLDSGASQELADLGGVFEDVQRHAADDHSVVHAVVSVGGRERPSRQVLGKRVERRAHLPRQYSM
jgi:hypothetical protein